MDEFIESKDEAMKLAMEWEKEYGCVRVYEGYEETIEEEGYCIYSVGEYPM